MQTVKGSYHNLAALAEDGPPSRGPLGGLGGGGAGGGGGGGGERGLSALQHHQHLHHHHHHGSASASHQPPVSSSDPSTSVSASAAQTMPSTPAPVKSNRCDGKRLRWPCLVIISAARLSPFLQFPPLFSDLHLVVVRQNPGRCCCCRRCMSDSGCDDSLTCVFCLVIINAIRPLPCRKPHMNCE
jgi:hypothetical protein